MKKKLALLLSAVMVMGSIPMTAFAASTNTVHGPITGTDGQEITDSNAPILEMKEGELRNVSETTFTLKLNNAEWAKDNDDKYVLGENSGDIQVIPYGSDVQKDVVVEAYTSAEDGIKLPAVKYFETAVTTKLQPGEEPLQLFYAGNTDKYDRADPVKMSSTDVYYLNNNFYSFDGTNYHDAALDGTNMLTDTVTGSSADGKVESITFISSTEVVITVSAAPAIDKIRVPMYVELGDEGTAYVNITDSRHASETEHRIATIVGGATVTSVSKLTDIQEKGATIETITIKETAAGSLNSGNFELKLSNGFEWKLDKVLTWAGTNNDIVVTPATGNNIAKITLERDKTDFAILKGEITFVTDKLSTAATTISLTGLEVQWDSDDVKAGDVAQMTISGSSSKVTKQTIDIGTAREHSVSWTAENKTVPTFYSGKADKDESTLKVTLEEVVAGSWLDSRKTTITFPEGVKVIGNSGDTITPSIKNGSSSIKSVKGVLDQKNEYSVITMEFDRDTSKSSKIKLEFEFELSIAPDFTGDVVATLGGSAIEEDMDVVIGTVKFPFEVEADTNEVQIDYRNVSIGDIIIKEVDTGLLEKGKHLDLVLEYIGFDGTPTVEIVEGDIKLGKISTQSDGTILRINIDSATSKTPAVLKITDTELYLQRSLPAGSYALKLAGDTFIQNKLGATINNKTTVDSTPKGYPTFDVSKVTVKKDFIDVITGGRDTGETFTTTITVTIGASTLMAGTREIPLDVPAYISGGYTMLPVRAVIEALSDAAIVRWDDPSHSITITFGSRVVSMTVGSSTMNINGVDVAMSKACEITDSRSFIPLRDLGYALGLSDNKINWDDATKTARLN